MVSSCHINVNAKPKQVFSKQKAGESCDPQFAHNKTVNPSGLLMTFSNVSILRGATRIGFQDEFLSRWQPWRGPDARKGRLDMCLSPAPLSRMRGNWDYFFRFSLEPITLYFYIGRKWGGSKIREIRDGPHFPSAPCLENGEIMLPKKGLPSLSFLKCSIHVYF